MVRFWIPIYLLWMLSGCTVSGSGTIPAKVQKDPKLLFEFGEERLKKGHTEEARTVFARVKRQFPLSQYAVLSELGTARAHRKEGNFITAAAVYRDFMRDYPYHEAVRSGMTTWWIGYCNYRLGPGDFFMFPPAQQRDLAHTRAAYEIFKMFMERYPESTYLPRVRKYYARTREMLVKHEFYVADFYGKKKKYKAVRTRMETVLTQFPDSPRIPGAGIILLRTYMRLGEYKNAVDLSRKIMEHYPNRPQAVEAAAILDKARQKLTSEKPPVVAPMQ